MTPSLREIAEIVGKYCTCIEEEEVLRPPKEIKPTKITNIKNITIRIRNTLAVGHRRRGDVGVIA